MASKLQHYSKTDKDFIANKAYEIQRDGVIEPSWSSWRAQVEIVKSEQHRKRLCINCSQTINKFTLLDVYPLPNVWDVVNKVAQYKRFSSLDLRSAYHQVPIMPKEQYHTAFEANGQLYQFRRMPFGLKNAVPCLQRVINDIRVGREKRMTRIWASFLKQWKTIILPLTTISASSRKILYHYQDSTSRKQLQRVVEMYAYYAQWISQFSEKINLWFLRLNFLRWEGLACLADAEGRFVSGNSLGHWWRSAFCCRNRRLRERYSCFLEQRKLAFFTRMLIKCELRQSSVEKEASAIVEAVSKWTHYLMGRKFTIVTDQGSVPLCTVLNIWEKWKTKK